ncbi:MAG: amidohydrolase, partial [Pseudomonadales bacterium]
MSKRSRIVRRTISMQRQFAIFLFVLLILGPLRASADTQVDAAISDVVNANTAELQEIFKDIHANPELGFMETRTARIVAEELSSLGFDVQTGIGVTGVVGILKNGDGPTLMFRADMDANAVEEATGLPYASEVRVVNLDGVETPVAHMCGHDAHTTWLIALGRTMAELKDSWQGTLVLVAQPAEEPIEGAGAMVSDGLYAEYGVPEPDYFLAFHTAPFPVGAILTTSGRITTGSRHIDVTFHGVGGHGSSPHHAIDPVMMAGMAIVQLQTVVSRMTDPVETAVLSIGSMQAGVDNNVIPTEATLKLKLHFSSEETGETMVAGIERIVNNVARTYGVAEENLPTITSKGYASVIENEPELISRIRSRLESTDLISLSVEDEDVPGSDDAFTLIKDVPDVKGAYLFLGTADHNIFKQAQEDGHEFPFFVHEPNYQVSLDA